jgi:hypothetical protein
MRSAPPPIIPKASLSERCIISSDVTGNNYSLEGQAILRFFVCLIRNRCREPQIASGLTPVHGSPKALRPGPLTEVGNDSLRTERS